MKDTQLHEKILIVVKGGVVQSVYASDPLIKVNVLDLDNEELKSEGEEEQILEHESKGLNAVL